MEQDTNQMKQMLAAARKEAADMALEKASERLTNQTNNISKLRMEFFDRLVLLDGGTISLSLTLIGLLQKAGKPTHYHLLLFSSWICFLASLLLAMLRNWREPDRLVAAEMTSYVHVVHEWFSASVQQVESLGVPTSDSTAAQNVVKQGPELVRQQQEQQKGLDKETKILGGAAMIFTVLGYLLLLWFAIVNAAVLL